MNFKEALETIMGDREGVDLPPVKLLEAYAVVAEKCGVPVDWLMETELHRWSTPSSIEKRFIEEYGEDAEFYEEVG